MTTRVKAYKRTVDKLLKRIIEEDVKLTVSEVKELLTYISLAARSNLFSSESPVSENEDSKEVEEVESFLEGLPELEEIKTLNLTRRKAPQLKTATSKPTAKRTPAKSTKSVPAKPTKPTVKTIRSK